MSGMNMTKVWKCRDKSIGLSEPILMGVVNVTPDSFSDGGQFFHTDKAIQQAEQLFQDGATVIDIGGESSRPGSVSVSPEEQIRRVVPVIKGLQKKYPDAAISIDTTSSKVARAAVAAGACIINDISGFTHDAAMTLLARETGAGIVIMHMQGKPSNMQDNPQYKNCVADIYDWLQKRIQALTKMGIRKESIVVDPGIGFGKKLSHNLEILQRLEHFISLGTPVLIGASRKQFIGISGRAQSPQNRLPGSLAALTAAVLHGAAILRVHDVAESLQAARVAAAIRTPAQWENE